MGEGGSPPPLPFSVSVIPGNFKSNDSVSADSRGFTAQFFASADSKRLASVEMRERHRVRVSPFCKAFSAPYKSWYLGSSSRQRENELRQRKCAKLATRLRNNWQSPQRLWKFSD